MGLKFQCNRDPRKMKSVNGKKFCEMCCKHVYDVRKKSTETILKLKQEQGECCVIIYNDQLAKVEERIEKANAEKQKEKNPFSIAAGIAAATLLTSNLSAQTSSATPVILEETRNAEGKKAITVAETNDKDKEAKKIQPVLKGYVKRSFHKIAKVHNFTLGYYNDSSKFVVIKKFSSNVLGKFKVKLTKEELLLLQEYEYRITSGKHPVTHDHFNFFQLDKDLVLTVRKRIMWMGKF